MTICISAICTEKGKEHIVFAVDHMLSNRFLGEFEHSINKYNLINNNTILMLSGTANLMEYFTCLDNVESNFYDILNEIKSKFKEKRLEMIQTSVLDQMDINFDFMKENLNKEFKNPLIKVMFDEVLSTRLHTTLLLVGFDNAKAKINEISDGGTNDLRTINFHAIGSGSTQAFNTLLFQKQSINENLITTIYNVFKAKKNAEAMQGVGKETDLGYLNTKGVKMLNEKDLNNLENIYNNELTYGKTHEDLKNINLSD